MNVQSAEMVNDELMLVPTYNLDLIAADGVRMVGRGYEVRDGAPAGHPASDITGSVAMMPEEQDEVTRQV